MSQGKLHYYAYEGRVYHCSCTRPKHHKVKVSKKLAKELGL
jgi:hypothetical protein